MKVTWLGHAAFLIDDLIIDPFISGNPSSPVKVGDIKCKYVCVTHDHSDHLGDAVEIAKKNNATFISIFELASDVADKGVKTTGMNIGGPAKIGEWEIRLVPAIHSSTKGSPTGFVLKKDKKTIYHAGDTGLFMDMMLIGEYNLDLAMIPIGGYYVMDAEQALESVKLLKPHSVIPMHYNTWPVIKADPQRFKKLVEDQTGTKVIVLKPGEHFVL